MRQTFRTLRTVLLPPSLFLPVAAAFSIGSRGPPGPSVVPWILVVTECALAVLALAWVRRERLSHADLGLDRWTSRQIAWGLLLGVGLALAYQSAIAPALDWLRANLGDVIPPGETRGALNTARVPFFIANVVLAPWVEELLYRGILEHRLRSLWGPRASFLWGAFAFGLLHWAGGVFYVLATGLLGALLLLLRRRTGSLAPSTACHFAFNVLEVVLSLGS